MSTKNVAYKVIQDKRVPPMGKGGGGMGQYPFADMKVNAYFVAKHTNVAWLANRWARVNGSSSKFVSRAVNGEIRIYRSK